MNPKPYYRLLGLCFVIDYPKWIAYGKNYLGKQVQICTKLYMNQM